MKRKFLKNAAIFGIASGLMLLDKAGAAEDLKSKPSAITTPSDPNAGNLGYHLMTEDELVNELNDDGYKLYMSMDEEGKALARKVASARCDHTNECKGLNACATDKHGCAGQGDCKHTGKCGMSDKNLAVKIVYKKMQEKRNQALSH